MVQSGNNKKHGKYQLTPYPMQIVRAAIAFGYSAIFVLGCLRCRVTVFVIYVQACRLRRTEHASTCDQLARYNLPVPTLFEYTSNIYTMVINIYSFFLVLISQ